jgi:hypothetical protein
LERPADFVQDFHLASRVRTNMPKTVFAPDLLCIYFKAKVQGIPGRAFVGTKKP